MLLRRLQLTDLRSYVREAIDLEAGVTLIVGPNAQGKTNLLEAVYRLATGSSHRVGSDLPLVRNGATSGAVRALVTTDDGRRRTVELELRPGRGSRARVDGQYVRRSSDAVGVLQVVLFAPEDVALVRGEPAGRRAFLDDLLAQRRPVYASARSEFERVVRQRNQLLRTTGAGGNRPDPATRETLAVWTEQLIEYGALISAARIAAVHGLAGPAADFYQGLADQPESVGLVYRSSAGFEVGGTSGAGVPDRDDLMERLRAAIAAVGEEEQRRGVSLVGPQRDDLELTVRGLPAREYASHGQAWSLALSLRLAMYEVLAEVGDRPIVLLDDVFTELDESRRRRLAAACTRWQQVLFTTAVEHDVPLEGRTIDVWLDAGGSHATPRNRSNVA